MQYQYLYSLHRSIECRAPILYARQIRSKKIWDTEIVYSFLGTLLVSSAQEDDISF